MADHGFQAMARSRDRWTTVKKRLAGARTLRSSTGKAAARTEWLRQELPAVARQELFERRHGVVDITVVNLYPSIAGHEAVTDVGESGLE